MLNNKISFRKYKTLLQWIIGLGLLIYLVSRLSLDVLFKDLQLLRWDFLTYSFLLKFGLRIIASYKWYILVSVHHVDLPFKKALMMHFFGGAIGQIVPMVGSDVGVGYAYYKYSGKAENSVSSIMMDRIIGLYSTIITAFIGILVSMDLLIEIQQIKFMVWGCLISGFILNVLLYYLFSHPRYLEKLCIPHRLIKFPVEIFGLLKDYVKNKKNILILNAVLASSLQILRIVSTYLLALAVGTQISIWYFMCVVPLIFLISQLPVSANGLGVEEGAFVILLGIVGVSAENAFSMSMIGRILTLGTVIPGTIWVMLGGLGNNAIETNKV